MEADDHGIGNKTGYSNLLDGERCQHVQVIIGHTYSIQ